MFFSGKSICLHTLSNYEQLYSELCGTGASVTVYPDDHVEYTESESPSILSQNPSQNISKKKEKKQYDYIVVEEHFTQNDIRSLQYIYSSVKDGNSFSDKNSFDNSASQGSTSSSSQRKRKDGLFVKKSWLVNCLKKNEILPWYGYAIAGNTYFKNHIFILDGFTGNEYNKLVAVILFHGGMYSRKLQVGCTHLVLGTSKRHRNIRKAHLQSFPKILCVSYKWIVECVKQERRVSTKKFQYRALSPGTQRKFDSQTSSNSQSQLEKHSKNRDKTKKQQQNQENQGQDPKQGQDPEQDQQSHRLLQGSNDRENPLKPQKGNQEQQLNLQDNDLEKQPLLAQIEEWKQKFETFTSEARVKTEATAKAYTKAISELEIKEAQSTAQIATQKEAISKAQVQIEDQLKCIQALKEERHTAQAQAQSSAKALIEAQSKQEADMKEIKLLKEEIKLNQEEAKLAKEEAQLLKEASFSIEEVNESLAQKESALQEVQNLKEQVIKDAQLKEKELRIQKERILHEAQLQKELALKQIQDENENIIKERDSLALEVTAARGTKQKIDELQQQLSEAKAQVQVEVQARREAKAKAKAKYKQKSETLEHAHAQVEALAKAQLAAQAQAQAQAHAQTETLQQQIKELQDHLAKARIQAQTQEDSWAESQVESQAETEALLREKQERFESEMQTRSEQQQRETQLLQSELNQASNKIKQQEQQQEQQQQEISDLKTQLKEAAQKLETQKEKEKEKLQKHNVEEVLALKRRHTEDDQNIGNGYKRVRSSIDTGIINCDVGIGAEIYKKHHDKAQHTYSNFKKEAIKNGTLTTVLHERVFFVSEDLRLTRNLFYYPYADLKQLIILYGGAISENIYDNNITHVCCVHRDDDLFHQTKAQNNREVVSHYWLQDVFLRCEYLSPSCSPLYYLPPMSYPAENSENVFLSVSGFCNEERLNLKDMVHALGCSYTSNLYQIKSTHLICRTASGRKFEKAMEWEIPVVNELWVAVVYLNWKMIEVPKSGSQSNLASAKYLIENIPFESKTNPITKQLESKPCTSVFHFSPNDPVCGRIGGQKLHDNAGGESEVVDNKYKNATPTNTNVDLPPDQTEGNIKSKVKNDCDVLKDDNTVVNLDLAVNTKSNKATESNKAAVNCKDVRKEVSGADNDDGIVDPNNKTNLKVSSIDTVDTTTNAKVSVESSKSSELEGEDHRSECDKEVGNGDDDDKDDNDCGNDIDINQVEESMLIEQDKDKVKEKTKPQKLSDSITPRMTRKNSKKSKGKAKSTKEEAIPNENEELNEKSRRPAMMTRRSTPKKIVAKTINKKVSTRSKRSLAKNRTDPVILNVDHLLSRKRKTRTQSATASPTVNRNSKRTLKDNSNGVKQNTPQRGRLTRNKWGKKNMGNDDNNKEKDGEGNGDNDNDNDNDNVDVDDDDDDDDGDDGDDDGDDKTEDDDGDDNEENGNDDSDNDDFDNDNGSGNGNKDKGDDDDDNSGNKSRTRSNRAKGGRSSVAPSLSTRRSTRRANNNANKKSVYKKKNATTTTSIMHECYSGNDIGNGAFEGDKDYVFVDQNLKSTDNKIGKTNLFTKNAKKKRTALQNISPTNEQSPMAPVRNFKESRIENEAKSFQKNLSSLENGKPVRVLFTGIDSVTVESLSKIVVALGGEVVQEETKCTHVVAERIARTVKFLCGINVCEHLTTKDWLVQSKEAKTFLMEEAFPLVDRDAELKFKFNLTRSLELAKERKVMENIFCFIARNTKPLPKELAKIINSAGGSVLKRKPSKEEMIKYSPFRNFFAEKSIFILIASDKNQRLIQQFDTSKCALFIPEFILSGVLAQKLNFYENRLI